MTKRDLLWLGIILIILVGLMPIAHAQSGPIFFLEAQAGTTVTNCGTPTEPAICGVSTGVFAWQNSTTGWFLLAPAGAAASPTLTINGTTKTLPASFTLTGTVGAPTITSTSNAPSATIAAN